MNDKLNENEQESDGSESRLNTIIKPDAAAQPQTPPAFESWMDPQSESEKTVLLDQVIEGEPIVYPAVPPSPLATEIEPEIHIKPPPTNLEPSPQVTPTSINSEDPIKGPDKPRGKTRKPALWLVVLSVLLIVVFFFTPIRVTTLILGIDWRPSTSPWLGRSDTMIVTTLPPVSPQVSMLSIPRDLWVTIPNHYDNRINTAHYFAELEAPNTGMQAAKDVIEQNFGIKVNYVVRLKFTSFVEVVDAFGGVTVNLPEDMSGLNAGPNHLDGAQALAFVRDRKSSDDFFRLERGQLFIASAIKEVFNPLKWPRIPAVLAAVAANIETDLPIWLWPRTAYGMLFSALKGFDAQTIDRNMITPWVTDEGAQVLLPNWELINPMVDEMFK